MQISIYPDRLRQFGEVENSIFYLVTNSSLINVFKIEKTKNYKDFRKVIYDPEDDFLSILQNKIEQPAHIFVITPQCLFESIPPNLLGTKRKLLIFACNSAPTSLESIKFFLRHGEKINPLEQEQIADKFFSDCESTNILQFVDSKYETVAKFNHFNEFYGWHEQSGMLGWGEQQIFPSGEIACFLVPLKGINQLPDIQFELNGEIALKGSPVVHSGSPSFLREDQERIYKKLSFLREHPIIAKLENGIIKGLRVTHPSVNPALEILEAIFMVDSRFRQVFEIGFAINNKIKIIPENSAMNEVYGGENGCVHFGLGMLPYTQYHIDLICPDIEVIGKNDKVIFASKQ